MNWTRRLALLAMAVLPMTIFAYEDDFMAIDLGANATVATNWVGDRLVYVFTNVANATASSTLTLKQVMTLEEALVVGGGGAGGGFKGGGGGGGGVIYDETSVFMAAGSELSVSVGAGGIGNANRNAAQPQGNGAGYGYPSSLHYGDTDIVAYGGGGGGSDASTRGASSKMTADVSIGCGGGAGAYTTSNQTDQYYTPSQGYYGGIAASSASSGTGGGGGAGSPGQNGTYVKGSTKTSASGNGGEGVTNEISGVKQVYGSGGGGGGAVSTINTGLCTPGLGGTNAGDGSQGPNTSTPTAGAGRNGFGGGGGGGGYNSAASAGGNGGSGTVILSFTVGGAASAIEIDEDDIVVAFPDGYTQPRISVTAGGDPGATYAATVVVYGGTGAAAAAGDEYQTTNVFTAVHLGDVVSTFVSAYPQPGESVYVKVVASADGVPTVTVFKTVVVPSDQGLVVPPYVGHGGDPQRVIHVRDGARGRKDGRNWADAYDDFREALKLLDETHSELWYSGTNMVDVYATTFSPSCPVALRGGFTGIEDSPSERRRGVYSAIDGSNLYNCLVLNNSTNMTVDGFIFTRGRQYGLYKRGAGALLVTNCVADSNGLTVDTVAGRGFNLAGNAALTSVTVVDCRIANHRERATLGTAGAMYLSSLRDATVSSCYFTSNGLSFTARAYADHPGREGAWGAALAVNGVRTTVENCEFRGNVSQSVYIYGEYGGGVVRLIGASGGSVFRNCAFIGNASLYSKTIGYSYTDPDGGALVVRVSGDEPVQVENCTFAFNVYSGRSSTAGLNVYSGTAAVTNTVFYGNICGTATGVRPADVLVQSGATALCGYTCFSEPTNRVVAGGGTLVVGTGCFDADPLFVTSTNSTFSTLYRSAGAISFNASASAAIAGFNCHLRGRAGYFDERSGAWTHTERGTSPAIDAGDPASDFSREPFVCRISDGGKAINLGRWGNTPYATMTPHSGSVLVVR